jgi:mRNA interferase MazF
VGDPVDYLSRDQLGEVGSALAHYLGIQDAGSPRYA